MDKTATYRAAAHAMQSGVATKMNIDPAEVSPKHLRVGINSAMSDQKALARLLIARGLFTDEEYAEAIRVAMIEEAESYERELSELTGKKITLI